MARQIPPATIQSYTIPAPLDGLNTVAPAGASGPTEAIRAYNVIPAESGLRHRSGYRYHFSGVRGYGTDNVRTLVPYLGTSTQRLFAVTAYGIFNVSTSYSVWTPSTAYVVGNYVINDYGKIYVCDQAGTSSSTPVTSGGGPTGTGTNITDGVGSCRWDYFGTTLEVAFPSVSGRAGFGIYTNFVNLGGHWLVYCDEVNGAYLYNGSAWAALTAGYTVAWTQSTAYLVGDIVYNGVNVYQCTVAGVSAVGTGPTAGSDPVPGDGTVTWDHIGTYSASTIGTSLSDQRAGLTATPSKFVYVNVWKNRLWFVERDTARAWYLPLNAIYGTATSLEMGTKFRQGGTLVGLWNWTMDGGAGIDDSLVAISTGGDVSIYQGTDPSSASTFGLKGVWYAGSVPAGRRIASNNGGDLLIASKLGILPISALVAGQAGQPGQYATAKIANLFNQYMYTSGNSYGWSMVLHPDDNALLVTVPYDGEGVATRQLAMSFSTKGWFEYRELPVLTAEVVGGKFYFGTTDGKIAVSEGNLDNGSAIQYRFITTFQNLGSARFKRVQSIRPTIFCEGGTAGYKLEARYRYNTAEMSNASVATPSSGWDYAVWDSAVWSESVTVNQVISGATGAGVELAIAFRGAANSRTVLVGMDVMYDVGGLL